MKRISSQIQKFVLQPQNSWIHKVGPQESIEVGDINTHMDLFFIVKGAVEITMREDPIHRARKAESSGADEESLMTESEVSFDSQQSQLLQYADTSF